MDLPGGGAALDKINTKDGEIKPSVKPAGPVACSNDYTYLQHLPAFSFCSVSSAALSAELAAESLRCTDLLEDLDT